MTADKMYWLDIETTGLDVETDTILEIGFLVTDLELVPLAKTHWTIGSQVAEDVVKRRTERGTDEMRRDATFVFDMHTESDLWVDVAVSDYTLRQVEAEAAAWLKEQGIDPKTDPMCGSSVHFDRAFLKHHMPYVERLFHYRNIDISTLKELAKRWTPVMFEHQQADLDLVMNTPHHRVFSDVENTVNEARWYAENFVLVEA